MTSTSTLPPGLEWNPDTGQWVVRTQELANIVLRDPHIGMAVDPGREPVALPSADEIPTVPQFFELWYHRGANHPTFKHQLRTAYSAAAVEPFAPVFEELAAELAAQLPPEGDLVASYVAPYCLHSTFALMGFPREAWPNLTKVYHVLMFVIRQRFRGVLELPDRQRAAFESSVAFLRDAVTGALASDEPTALVTAFREYAATGEHDVWADVATIGQLLAAGVPQVTTGTAVSIRALYTEPEVAGRVRTGELDVESVAEEAMRLAPPFLGIFGWVSEPCDCLGVRLEPRTAVVVDIPAVNTDPERVAAPAAFCPARPRSANITFGKGAHYCLGAASARIQVASALRGLLATRPALAVGEPRIDHDGFAQTVAELPFAPD